ncbi:fork head transcription factor Fkh2 [Schizosaccharomyces japonicus yFS275]|uniref:Fork head transcription factor Fkh2 n=1 Tax=Schizosaccharomyces japonicus (strain yFS275 / FY16936) TaxID=402676 RepID=B6K7U1_SCHJY|nr:fork head transcription factor Fkh2 [Schizosaccharomyces japonicus yFS275]EEB09595.1 fork head transcription factor Fkh2 [Schizosaccharomyces japonicus yFS275]
MSNSGAEQDSAYSLEEEEGNSKGKSIKAGNRRAKSREKDRMSELDATIAKLPVPDGTVNLVRKYSNDENAKRHSGGIQAYAKFAGSTWTYYVQKLRIVLGREPNGSSSAPPNVEPVDMDFGPSKLISRKHAVVVFDLNTQQWNCTVHGRNGIRVNGKTYAANSSVTLESGYILDIGGVQMMFVLPDQVERGKKESTTSSEQKQTANESVANEPTTDGEAYHPFGNQKPPYSYSVMIAQAILSTSDSMMTLSKIYSWIQDHYPYYRTTKSGWQNSIRHNLSLNKAFHKVPRKCGEIGKGMKWSIAPEYREEFLIKARLSSKRKSSEVASSNDQYYASLKEPKKLHASPARSRERTPVTPKKNIERPVVSDVPSTAKSLPTRTPNYKTPVRTSLSDLIASREGTPVGREYTAPSSAGSVARSTSRFPTSSPAPFWKYVDIPSVRNWPQINSYESISPYRNPINSHMFYSPAQAKRSGFDEQVHDLQGVDLVHGFEGISSWRESLANKNYGIKRESLTNDPPIGVQFNSKKTEEVLPASPEVKSADLSEPTLNNTKSSASSSTMTASPNSEEMVKEHKEMQS